MMKPIRHDLRNDRAEFFGFNGTTLREISSKPLVRTRLVVVAKEIRDAPFQAPLIKEDDMPRFLAAMSR
jgi:hypothetical protein